MEWITNNFYIFWRKLSFPKVYYWNSLPLLLLYQWHRRSAYFLLLALNKLLLCLDGILLMILRLWMIVLLLHYLWISDKRLLRYLRTFLILKMVLVLLKMNNLLICLILYLILLMVLWLRLIRLFLIELMLLNIALIYSLSLWMMLWMDLIGMILLLLRISRNYMQWWMLSCWLLTIFFVLYSVNEINFMILAYIIFNTYLFGFCLTFFGWNS